MLSLFTKIGFALLLLTFVACGGGESESAATTSTADSTVVKPPPPPELPNVEADVLHPDSTLSVVLDPLTFAAKYKVTEGAVLIDVRTPEEVENGKIEGSMNINYRKGDFEEKMLELDKETPIFLYCASGGRSSNTANFLVEQGYKQIYDLKKGITGWRIAGLEIVK